MLTALAAAAAAAGAAVGAAAEEDDEDDDVEAVGAEVEPVGPHAATSEVPATSRPSERTKRRRDSTVIAL
jgi:hypothetical protein